MISNPSSGPTSPTFTSQQRTPKSILLLWLAVLVLTFVVFSTHFSPSNFELSGIVPSTNKESSLSVPQPAQVNDQKGDKEVRDVPDDAPATHKKQIVSKHDEVPPVKRNNEHNQHNQHAGNKHDGRPWSEEIAQLQKQLHSARKRLPTNKPSADRLAPYVNKNYVSAAQNAAGGDEWSFDKLEREYKEELANATYYTGNGDGDRNLLFIDSREQCEAHRKFLITVRQSGFKGKIVLLVYYKEDEADCQPLANAFKPMIVFYRDTPLFEPTLAMYHGIVHFARAFPQHINKDAYDKVIVVKPDAVFWCNKSNPFNDIPSNSHEDSIFGVIGRQSDIFGYDMNDRNPGDECYGRSGRYNGTDDRLRHNFLVDALVGSSTIMGMVKFARLVVDAHQKQDFDEPYSPYDFFKNFLDGTDPISIHLRERLFQIEPAERYTAAICTRYLPPDDSCLTCNRSNVVVGTTLCHRKVTYEVPNYTPYCIQPYRDAILEVPYTTTMMTYARDEILRGAHGIRDRPEGIFAEPANITRMVSEQCPDGTLGVLTMMAGYTVKKVWRYIGSFISHANPNCTKLIMMVERGKNMESLLKHFSHHIELVYLEDNSEYSPVKMRGCKPADSRFEVAQRWLEKNYQRFRYLMGTDSRDYIWLADPLAQLVRVLRQQSYDEEEFVGSVAEPYIAGAATYPSRDVTDWLRTWLKSCGEHCYRKISHMKFTNGEPFAVLNSGHVIGTTLGLLHYYRFHVRMMADSGHHCDGTDQGLFTYYMYGMLQEAHYPHKVLAFSSSRSGFANMPSPSRMAKRNGTVPGEIEYTITDCNNNIFAGLHQFDRYKMDYELLENTPATLKPWQPWLKKNTFDSEFHD